MLTDFVKATVVGVPADDIQHNLFTCSNGEYILQTQVCDGNIQCRDGTDEQDCGKSEISMSSVEMAQMKRTVVSLRYQCPV